MMSNAYGFNQQGAASKSVEAVTIPGPAFDVLQMLSDYKDVSAAALISNYIAVDIKCELDEPRGRTGYSKRLRSAFNWLRKEFGDMDECPARNLPSEWENAVHESVTISLPGPLANLLFEIARQEDQTVVEFLADQLNCQVESHKPYVGRRAQRLAEECRELFESVPAEGADDEAEDKKSA